MTCKKTVSLVSLGCPKNLIDSETLLGHLMSEGYEPVSDTEYSDLAVLNTCAFIKSAREEAFGEIEALIARKKSGAAGSIAVCGCLIPVIGEDLKKRYPEVDRWLGPFDEEKILLPMETPAFCHQVQKPYIFRDANRIPLTEPHVAYLKIAEGCDRFCSYCAIPNIRGRFTSKPMNRILDEARRLADSGVRELILIAQETTFWGMDLPEKPHLAILLEQLRRTNLFDWIRVLYAYPTGWDEDLIAQFAEKPSPGQTAVLPYIDLPLQHISDRLLAAMNRRVRSGDIDDLLSRLTEAIPDLTLRTTFIVGFPGETEEEFNQLTAFVKKWKFPRCGVFAYSPEAGTKAALLPNPVDEKTKKQRYKKLSALSQKLADDFARRRVGTSFDVYADTPLTDEEGNIIDGVWLGRSMSESPDIDPIIYINGENIRPCQKLQAEAVAVHGPDLVAAVLD